MEQKKQEIEENKREKEKKDERLVGMIILILIALIIIIFLIIHCFGLIKHKPLIPTGNVDIFDIIFGNGMSCSNCNCGCNNGQKNPECKCDSPECVCNGMNLPMTDEESSNVEYKTGNGTLGGVEVFDKDVKYSTDTKLNIFKQTSYYVVDDKFAPTSENSYQFVIRNHNNFNIKYDLGITETNDYNINMKYRLKLNGKYVVGDNNNWVTANELNRYNIGLANNSYDVYTLDWKWFESSNDTQVGTDIDSYYTLKLKITATQI